MRNQIVILAAGKGTRMGGNVPKVLVMLKNKPLILHLLEEVEKVNQLAKPVLVVGYKAKQVMDILGDGYIYAIQYDQLGTGHAVQASLAKVKGENILVLYGDMPFIKAGSLKKLMTLHHKNHAKISMFTTKVPNFLNENKALEHYGRVIRSSNKQIAKIVEFKDASLGQRKVKELNPGIYMFNTKWLAEHLTKIKNKNEQAEYYLTDIVEIAIAHGEKIENLAIDPKEVMGVNSWEDLERALKVLK